VKQKLAKTFSWIGIVGILLTAFVMLNHHKARAASGGSYTPGPNDVSVQGPNAAVDAPTAHYLIMATNGNVDVYVVGACDNNTAGNPGLQARLNGQTKTTTNDCTDADGDGNRNDLLFSNVPPGSTLRVDKINGQGHQKYTVQAVSRGAATNVYVTQLANPNRNTSAYGSDGDNYGVNVWMGGDNTFKMTVPCGEKEGATAWIKWKDADVGQYNQNGTLHISLRIENSDYGNLVDWFEIPNSKIQKNNQTAAYQIPGGVFPGDHIFWRWTNGDGHNMIQHVLPYSENPTQPSCKPQTVNNPDGWCQVLGASNPNPVVGQNVTVTVRFANTSKLSDGSAGNDWVTGQNTQHSGVLMNTGEAHVLNRTENPSSPPRDRLGTQLKWPSDYWTDRQFTVSSGSSGPVGYTFTIRHDSTGTNFGALCATTISWQSSVSVSQPDCNNTIITDRTGTPFYIVFYDSSGNVVHNTLSDGPAGIVNRSIQFDTFVEFPYLYPHNVYGIVLYAAGTNQELDQTTTPIGCMQADCYGQLFTAPGTKEPGEQFTGNYGVIVTNNTHRTYNQAAADYYVTVSTQPGLVLSGPNTTGIIAIPPGGATNLGGFWNLRSDYTGSIAADIFFQGANIDGNFGIACRTTYTPQTRPAIKVTQGDISAGGGFKYLQADGTMQCTQTANRYFSPLVYAGDNSVGGIRTFASGQSSGNPYISSADFGAYALGWIDSPGGPNNSTKYGFYSNLRNKQPGGAYNRFVFANDNPANLNGNIGGLLKGNFWDAHCAPDYYDQEDDSLNRTYTESGDGQMVAVNTLASGQYHYKNSSGHGVRIGIDPGQPAAITAGKQITIFVDGDAIITSNIQYGQWNFDMANQTNNSPYLVIITKGNLHVNSAITRLDGVYIAQPKDDATGGEFSSCTVINADGSLSLPNRTTLHDNCVSSLNVNGAVIAQRVRLLRAQGTLADNTGAAAENFNFIPSTVVGLPNFKPSTGAVINNSLDNLYSLPPVF
jgi:hypothetical protein